MRLASLTMLLFAVLIAHAQTYTVESVPNTKLISGSYVSNPDNILSTEAVATIDAQLKMLEDSTTAQVAVVMLKSIGSSDEFTFAQELFNAWGIGRASNDNGLLILYVEDERVIRFHTGDGMEAVLPDARCKQIQRDYMVPYFKDGDVNKGMIEGVTATVNILLNPSSAEEITAETESSELDYTGFAIMFSAFYGVLFLITFLVKLTSQKFRDSKRRERGTYPEQSLTKAGWLITYGLVPAIIVALFGLMGDLAAVGLAMITLYLYFIGTLIWRLVRMQSVIKGLLTKKKYFEVADIIKSSQLYWFFIGLVFPIPFFIYFFIHLYRKRYYRNYPRPCNVCNAPMKKLGEKEDDQYLSESAQMEEKLKSGDYDVWLCTSCGATELWFYKNSWSKYEDCPKCKTIAFHTKSTRTLRSATYSSSGEGERTKVCKFCDHTAVSTYTIPMLERSTSSSSSLSSGGSWGGGSSSGGGASSRW
ncbi:MAG TPA: TPM domain-containing protein [Chryseosolibacter sp.]